MSLRFEEPAWLVLFVPALLLAALSVLRLRGEEPLRLATIVGLRLLLITALVAALARPSIVRKLDDLAVVALVDVSQSIRRFGFAGSSDAPWAGAAEGSPRGRSMLAEIRDWIRSAAEARRPDDRIGVVVFDGEPTIVSVPRRVRDPVDEIDIVSADGTDIGAALRLGSVLFPSDANRRLLLVTDGNDTVGDVMSAVREATMTRRGVIPVDVLPITYSIGSDVQVIRVEAPPTGRPGQIVPLRVHLEASAPVAGELLLFREGRIVDLDPASSSSGRRVTVPAGRSVEVIMTTIDDAPVTRFAVVFEPDDPAADAIVENNRAETLTTNPGTGAVLLLRGRGDAAGASDDGRFAALLRSLGRPVVAGSPESMPGDLLALQAFDLVVLDNVGAAELDPHRQSMLVEYVERLGGGLLMTGGRNAFGAGGWRGTVVEPMLPVSLELPRRLQKPRAALVLVIDKSGSMSYRVAGTRTSQQEIANEAAALAIESLAARSYVGVIAFDTFPQTVVDLTVNENPKAIADSIRMISPGGGTNIAGALVAAHQMIRRAPDVDERRIVFLTDGVSQTQPIEQALRDLVAEGITLTTIGVGDHVDEALLERMAQIGGGEFHPVRNPRSLPRVMVDSVQMFNQPLLREVPFRAAAMPTGGRLAQAADGAPDLRGLVLTSPREDPGAVVELAAAPDEPLLAHWPAGVGYVAAFTSSIEGEWARQWLEWPGWSGFWSDVVRQASRPGAGGGLALETAVDGPLLRVALTVDEAAPIDPQALEVEAFVYPPEGRPVAIALRQVSARRFEAEHFMREPGLHVVLAAPREAGRPLAPLVAGDTRPAGEEFRRTRSNLALLREIAESTGGRILDPASPAALELFDRAGMDPIEAARSIWALMLTMALPLLLLDVASRRVAWSPARIAAATRSALRRRSAAKGAVGSLERLRRVGAARNTVDEAARAAALSATAERARVASRLREESRTEGSGAPALSAPSSSGPGPGEARDSGSPPPQRPAVPAEAGRSEPPREGEERSTTSSLLEAKRRAHGRFGKHDADSGSDRTGKE
ncbi:MAG TPA: VWA domain-containing protein [Phycisphaerales bacterium]|nr:VWA domain-containing protein [Phycisphaerales bacterium]HMP37345.1 VWA domain-containing protein [Phycisphaerales bacterium]